MRSIRTFSARREFLPHWAAFLLAVLVTHLVFMASPLHTRMLIGGTLSALMASSASDEPRAEIERRDDPERHGSHCGIEWTQVAQGTTLAGLLAAVVAGVGIVLNPHVLGMGSITLAVGPPSTGDAQARLQVFRE